jgi:uncharacterized surface protein with fasciclin (FAS1) repeats
MRKTMLLIAAALLGACSANTTPEGEDAAATASKPEATLSETLADRPDLSTLRTALKDTGLATAFEGKASYTLLAPTDGAFAKLGEAGKTLMEPEDRAALAQVLRDHALPGYVTVDDVNTAINSAKDGIARMPSLGSGPVSFSRSGADLVVTGADGTSARIDGRPVLATNGVIIPIDTVLKGGPAEPR